MPDEKCSVCTRPIRTMVFKDTGVCSDLCRKKRDGDDPLVQPVKARKS
jgi:predicted nucleic acid-binding Zn ribbon protein